MLTLIILAVLGLVVWAMWPAFKAKALKAWGWVKSFWGNTQGETTASGGIGFFGLLGVVFIALKLMGYISWSWWWVTAPLWGGFAVFLVIAAFVFTIAVFVDRT